jgi:hypothetical protein
MRYGGTLALLALAICGAGDVARAGRPLLDVGPFRIVAKPAPAAPEKQTPTLSTPGRIDPGTWNLSAPAVGSWAAIRATRDGDRIVLRPSADRPAECFGWIASPPLTVPEGNGEPGNFMSLKVRYTHPPGWAGSAPTMRVRMLTSNLLVYTETAVSGPSIQPGSTGGTIIAHFDRNRLTAISDIVLAIDLLSVQPPGVTADPNFAFVIEEATWSLVYPAATVPAQQWSTVYVRPNGDLVGFVNNIVSPIVLSRNVGIHASDGAYVIATTSTGLKGWVAADPGLAFTIDSRTTVVDAALTGEHVIYLLGNGEAYYWSFQRGTRTQLATGVKGVGTAGDGQTLLLLDFNNYYFRPFQYNPLGISPGVEPLAPDYTLDDLTGRLTRHY